MSGEIVFRARALFLRKDAQCASDIRTVNSLLDSSLHLLKFKESVCLFFFRYVLVEVRRGRAGALRVFEDVNAVVFALLDEVERLAEVVVSLAWKTDDDVAGQRQTPARALDALYALQVIAAFMAAPHQFQHAIAT